MMTDDAAELATYRQRLAAVEAKLARATTEADRYYYRTCAAGWRRSIEVLEGRIGAQALVGGDAGQRLD